MMIRLVCPNCRARYDVPSDVIPEAGRDVQCSNCGETWFEGPAAQDGGPPPRDPPVATMDDAAPDGAAARPAAQMDTDTYPGMDTAPEDDIGEDETQAATAKRPALSEEAAAIFAEERALESRRRAQRQEAVESQPDLGLDTPESGGRAARAREARDRMARLRDESGDTTAPRRSRESRRDLLPDVDEITQSLKGGAYLKPKPASPRPDMRDAPPRGFGAGFLTAIILGGLVGTLYAYAGDLGAAAPQAQPALDILVQYGDAARIWLDGQSRTLLQTLDSFSSEASPGT